MMIQTSKGHAFHAFMKSMTLGRENHRKVVIFRRKMREFEVF